MVVKSFVLGDGSFSYQHTRSVAQLAVMRAMGANAAVINPYFHMIGGNTSSTVVGKHPFGLDYKLTLTTTLAPFGVTTATPTGVSVATGTTTVPAGTSGATYKVTGRQIKANSGSIGPVKVFCDQYLRQLALACYAAGLAIWLKPMLRTSTGSDATNFVPGCTKVVVKTTTGSTTVTAKTGHPFNSSMVGKRLLGLNAPLPHVGLTNYGKTSPNPVGTGTLTTQWCHIVGTFTTETGTSGNYKKCKVNVAATATLTTSTAVTMWIITETAAANWIINSTTAPTRTSWAGNIVWMATQVKTATGLTPAGCELITENTALTQWFATSWIKVCNLLHTKFPNMKLGVSTGGGGTITATKFAPAHFWTKLDYIGKETYSAAGSLTPGASLATVQAAWATWCTKAATLSAALGNKPIYFTECGYKAQYGFGTGTTKTAKSTPVTSGTITIPATTTTVAHTFETTSTIPGTKILVAKVYTASLTTTYTADFTVTGRTIKRKTASTPAITTFKVKYGYYTETTQANGLHAMLNACLGQSWFGGFMWWGWGVNNAGSMTPTAGVYSPSRTLATDATPTNVTHNWRQVGAVLRQQLAQRASFAAVL